MFIVLCPLPRVSPPPECPLPQSVTDRTLLTPPQDNITDVPDTCRPTLTTSLSPSQTSGRVPLAKEAIRRK